MRNPNQMRVIKDTCIADSLVINVGGIGEAITLSELCALTWPVPHCEGQQDGKANPYKHLK